MEKRKVFFMVALGFLLFNSIFISALTGSIGNARAVLYPEVNGWTNTVIDRTVNVKNTNEVPVLINLTLDSGGEKFIDLSEDNFILQPGEEKDAAFKIKVKKEGKYEGRINVFFSPTDTESKEAGVVLSSTIVVLAKKDQGYSEEDTKDTQENTDPVTGEVISENSKEKSSGSILLITSLILLLALLVLLYFMGKKGKKPNKKSRKKI